ncbi:MAG: hypothetical protein H6713_23540 [Myxococcales bacterium]|nr:hypothetical protein [Myxococcales bacterium]
MAAPQPAPRERGPEPRAASTVAPREPACDNALGRARFGEVIYEEDTYIRPSGSELAELRTAAPALAESGYRIIAAASVDLASAPTLRWVVLASRDAEPLRTSEDRGVYPELWAGPAVCVPGEGFSLLEPPTSLGVSIRVGLERVERVPSRADHASLLLRRTSRDGDFEAELVVLRAAGPRELRVTSVGSLEYWRTRGAGYESAGLVDASGWFPRGDERVYLQLRQHDGRVDMRALATITAAGEVTPGDHGRPTWVLAGDTTRRPWARAELPPACAGATRLRCAALELRDADLSPRSRGSRARGPIAPRRGATRPRSDTAAPAGSRRPPTAAPSGPARTARRRFATRRSSSTRRRRAPRDAGARHEHDQLSILIPKGARSVDA